MIKKNLHFKRLLSYQISISIICLMILISRHNPYFMRNKLLMSLLLIMNRIKRIQITLALPPRINKLNHGLPMTQNPIKALPLKSLLKKLRKQIRDKMTTIMLINLLQHCSIKHAKIVES